jgi:hypothetical protein
MNAGAEESTAWVLCKDCLYLQWVLAKANEKMFVENTVYKWGVLSNGWPETRCKDEVRLCKSDWAFFLEGSGVGSFACL